MRISPLYYKIVSIDNLLTAWEEFFQDKKKKMDVRVFVQHLLQNIFSLHDDLINFTYRHASYERFHINDPKQRLIHKACVRDRIVHHAVYRILYPIFDKGFIYDSYSCRADKGTHKAVNRLEYFIRKVNRNYTGPCWALKCDIRKFFDSVNHEILFTLIKKKINDKAALKLIWEIISSFSRKRGIPIGNLTSQLFANIYLTELDRFIKHDLKIKLYLRYCDDFIILDIGRNKLEKLTKIITIFLGNKLKLELHPKKIIIRKLRQGIDFLGFVILPKYRLLRNKTKRRIIKKLKRRVFEYKTGLITDETLVQSLNSYLGVLSHADTYEFKQDLLNYYWFWLKE